MCGNNGANCLFVPLVREVHRANTANTNMKGIFSQIKKIQN